MGEFYPTYSTDNIWREDDMMRCLTDDLVAIETDIAALETGKSDAAHTHIGYASAIDVAILEDLVGDTSVASQISSAVDGIQSQLDGKAPAGYGLGEAFVREINFSEIDNTKVNGLYRFTTSTTLNGVDINYCRMRVENYDHNWLRQTVITHNGNTELIRDCTDGVWGSWECPNPPMKLGVEYRTTSRWCEKPVYTQLINVGDLPNQTTKTVNWSTPSGTVTHVISCTGTISGSGDTIPYRGSGNGEIAVSATPTYIMIAVTGYNLAGSDGIVELRYVK